MNGRSKVDYKFLSNAAEVFASLRDKDGFSHDFVAHLVHYDKYVKSLKFHTFYL